jgi:hypothetical protein
MFADKFTPSVPLGRQAQCARLFLTIVPRTTSRIFETCAGLGLCLVVLAGSAEANADYPEIVRGIWMQKTSNGREQCRNYKAALRAGPEYAGNYLVGAELIGRSIWHSYSEYGEGNFYFVDSLALVGKLRWSALVSVGIDSVEREDARLRAGVRFRLEGRRLQFRVGGPGKWNKHDAQFRGESYFRCASLPPHIYNKY